MLRANWREPQTPVEGRLDEIYQVLQTISGLLQQMVDRLPETQVISHSDPDITVLSVEPEAKPAKGVGKKKS